MTEANQLVTEARCAKGVMVISWGFFGVFAGFGAAQALQSSLNPTLGDVNLAAAYTAFVAAGLVCSPVISSVVTRYGWRSMLVVSACTYPIMILSNLDSGSSRFVAEPLANVLVGVGGACLWTTQNIYFGQCASHCSLAAASRSGIPLEDAVKVMTTQFNSSFFWIFQFSNTAGCLLSSSLMLAFSGVAWLKELLFVVLAALALCGAATLLLLPHIDIRRDSREEAPSLTSALRALSDSRFMLLMPWILSQGMTYAFVNADFTSDVVSPLLGPAYVGFIAAVFFLCDTVFTIFWSRLISKRHLTRRLTFIASATSWMAFCVVKMAWTRPPNFQKVGEDWKSIPGTEVDMLDIVLPVVLAVLAGAGDAFWNPGPPAVLQSFFADSNLIGTMAAYKTVQSLGFAVQFALGAVLQPHPEIRGAILFCCCVASCISVIYLDSRKQSLDPRISTNIGSVECERDFE